MNTLNKFQPIKKLHDILFYLKTTLKLLYFASNHASKSISSYFSFCNPRNTLKKLDDDTVLFVENLPAFGLVYGIFHSKIYGSLTSEKVIIDIGANRGYFSVYAGKHLTTQRVYAYEPHPNTFSILEQTIKLNKLSNVIPVNKAVTGYNHGDKGSLFLIEDRQDYSLSNSQASDESNISSITVDTINLSEILKTINKEVDLLKMNCEGAEYEILENTPIKQLHSIKKIRLEYHNMVIDKKKYTVSNLIDIMEKKDFIVKKNIPYGKTHGIIWLERK